MPEPAPAPCFQIVAIACARNEADIIESFARHTLSYCQHLIILDHGSADATPEILAALQSEGLNLHIISDSRVGSFQTEHMNLMLKMAVRDFAADWVVCLDADEFIQGDLISGLTQPNPVSEPCCFKIPLRNYIVHPSDDPKIVNLVERIKHYDSNPVSDGSLANCKVIVPRVLGQKENAFIEQGNHRFLDNGFKSPCFDLPNVWLGHFSLRQPSQYAGKLV